MGQGRHRRIPELQHRRRGVAGQSRLRRLLAEGQPQLRRLQLLPAVHHGLPAAGGHDRRADGPDPGPGGAAAGPAPGPRPPRGTGHLRRVQRPVARFHLPRPEPYAHLPVEPRHRPHRRHLRSRPAPDEDGFRDAGDAPRHPAALLRRRDDVRHGQSAAGRRPSPDGLPGRLGRRSGEPVHRGRPGEGRRAVGPRGRPPRLRPHPLPVAQGLLGRPARQDPALHPREQHVRLFPV